MAAWLCIRRVGSAAWLCGGGGGGEELGVVAVTEAVVLLHASLLL